MLRLTLRWRRLQHRIKMGPFDRVPSSTLLPSSPLLHPLHCRIVCLKARVPLRCPRMYARLFSSPYSTVTVADIPRQESVRSIPPGYVYVGSQLQPAPAFAVSLPKGSANGRFVTIDQDELAKATASTKLGSFVNVGIEAQEFNTSKSEPRRPKREWCDGKLSNDVVGNIPAFIPRRSRNDFKKAAAGNPKLLCLYPEPQHSRCSG